MQRKGRHCIYTNGSIRHSRSREHNYDWMKTEARFPFCIKCSGRYCESPIEPKSDKSLKHQVSKPKKTIRNILSENQTYCTIYNAQ